MKCLLITGASSGIGLRTAQRFLDEDFTVVNLSRRPCPLDAVSHMSCDLSSPAFLQGIGDELALTLKEAEHVVLVHNAARMENDTAISTTSANLREVLELNLVAPNTLNHFAIPYMGAGSSIIFIGSTLSEKAVAGSYTYVVSKHAMVGMMRALCQDLVGRSIHTACVCPGLTDTEMLRQRVPDETTGNVPGMSTFGRLIQPGEIAELIYWSAINPVINGAVIHAHLGQKEY